MARTIGLIGLGLLGSALARRFLAAGHGVLGYDLSPTARQSLLAAGGETADAATHVIDACDTVVLCLPDSQVVAEVVRSVDDHFKRGQLVIDVTTGAPADAVALGERLARHGVLFSDATIAGSSAQVDLGQVTVMAGGDPAAVEAARDLFACFADKVFHVGACGNGSRMKLVVNLVLGLNRAVLAEGLTLANALGLDGATALDILKAGPAFSTVMETKGPKMLSGDFAPQARLSQHLKDVRLIFAAAGESGLELPLSAIHRTLLEHAEAQGYGDQDNSAIVRAFGGKR